jgi:hypothetical protein
MQDQLTQSSKYAIMIRKGGALSKLLRK